MLSFVHWNKLAKNIYECSGLTDLAQRLHTENLAKHLGLVLVFGATACVAPLEELVVLLWTSLCYSFVGAAGSAFKHS